MPVDEQPPPGASLATRMRHKAEVETCPIVDAVDNYHFELICEDCDVKRLSRSTLGQVEYYYRTGRITQDEFEGYMCAWAFASPAGSEAEWKAASSATVRRIARKLLRRRGLDVPAELLESSASATSGQHADTAAYNTVLAGDGLGWLTAMLPPPQPLICSRHQLPMRLPTVPLLWECPACVEFEEGGNAA